MSDIYDCVQVRIIIIKTFSCIVSYCNLCYKEEL